MRVFEFRDYKQFLRLYIREKPKKGRGLIKTFAAHLRIDSSQVSKILSGDKDLTEEQGLLMAKFIGLTELETEYFLALIKIERAGTKLLADHYREKRDRLKTESLNLNRRVKSDRILSDFEKSVFYSSHLYSAIRLSTSIGNGQTLTEIVDRFQIPREKAAGILDFLTSTSLCREENGRYRLGTQHTHVERGSPFLARHHQNWRVKGLERMESISDQELQFTGPVSINKKDFESIREDLVELVSKALKKVKEGEPADVACLLIDWFWIRK